MSGGNQGDRWLAGEEITDDGTMPTVDSGKGGATKAKREGTGLGLTGVIGIPFKQSILI